MCRRDPLGTGYQKTQRKAMVEEDDRPAQLQETIRARRQDGVRRQSVQGDRSARKHRHSSGSPGPPSPMAMMMSTRASVNLQNHRFDVKSFLREICCGAMPRAGSAHRPSTSPSATNRTNKGDLVAVIVSHMHLVVAPGPVRWRHADRDGLSLRRVGNARSARPAAKCLLEDSQLCAEVLIELLSSRIYGPKQGSSPLRIA